MTGGGKGQENDPSTATGISRQQSNWAEEMRAHSAPIIPTAVPEESQPALDLSGLLSMLASVDSQVTSLEAAMDPRTSREREGGLSEAYGRQAYESLGPMLREIQTTSAAMANQVQALSDSVGLPPEMLTRSSRLVERVERACLAHRARCPPQELGVDISGLQGRRQHSPQRLGRCVRRRLWRANPEGGVSSSHERRLSRRESCPAGTSEAIAFARNLEGASLTRSRTLEDLVMETDEQVCDPEEQAAGVGHGDGSGPSPVPMVGSGNPADGAVAVRPLTAPFDEDRGRSPMDIVRRQSTQNLATETALDPAPASAAAESSQAPRRSSEAMRSGGDRSSASSGSALIPAGSSAGSVGNDSVHRAIAVPGQENVRLPVEVDEMSISEHGGGGGGGVVSISTSTVEDAAVTEGRAADFVEQLQFRGGSADDDGVTGEGGRLDEKSDPSEITSMDVQEGDAYRQSPDAEREDIDGDREPTGVVAVSPGRASSCVYSWGRGDLGVLLQSDELDHSVEEGRVALKDHWSVLQVSTALFHTMAVTASGDVIGCGQNDEGQVQPDLLSEEMLSRPLLVEPLLNHRVTQISCGLYHTACVTAAGVAITWGGNESGQLGHSPDATRRARPMAVQVAGAGQAWSSSRRAARVACGDFFTLILTSRAEVLSCGVGECVGGDGTDRKQAALVQTLAGFPAVWMACGNSHSVVIGSGGEAVAFGLNTHGQLGVGPMAEGDGPAVLLPRPVVGTSAESATMLSEDGKPRPASAQSSGETSGGNGSGRGEGGVTPPLFFAARAACGQSHTVFVSQHGEAWVCGRNRAGQLGLDPKSTSETPVPVRLPLSETSSGVRNSSWNVSESDMVVQPAAGRAHTMLLLQDGRVLGFGSDEFGVLGRGDATAEVSGGGGDEGGGENREGLPAAPAEEVTTQSWRWQPREIEGLRGRDIAFVSAGGEQSFAISLLVTDAEETGDGSSDGNSGAPILRQGSAAMSIRRRFSVPPVPKMKAANDFLHHIHRLVPDGEEKQLGAQEEEALLEAVRQTFGSPSVLSGSFEVARREGPTGTVVLELSRLDAEGLDKVYTSLMGLGGKFVSALASSVEQGLATVAAVLTSSAEGNPAGGTTTPISPPPLRVGVSCLLKYWQSPTLGVIQLDKEGNECKEAFVRLCRAVLELRAPARWRLMRSVQEDYPSKIFSERLVKPMLDGLARHLRVDRGRGSGVPSTALILKWLHSINELEGKVPYQGFFSEAVSSLPVESLLMDLNNWRVQTPEGRRNRFFFADHSFLISTETKKAMLKAEDDMQQRKAAGVGLQFIHGVGLVFNPYLVLQVHRANLLQETLAQVSRKADSDLRKKLKVVFVGEEGVDEGGVAKEFFQLLTVQLFDQSFGMFVPAGEEGRSLWFNKDCVWADEEYGLVGLLVGLAVYAGVILDVPFHLVTFRKVLDQPLSLKDLEGIDPGLLQGLQKLIEYGGDDVEDIFGVDFSVTWDDLGMQRTHELKPGGKDIPVTSSNKEEYVGLYAKFLLVDSISRQFEMFKRGFMRVMGEAHSIGLLRAEELDVLVTGLSELDFGELARSTKYDGGFSGEHPTVRAFWKAVEEMSMDEQKRLLMFATGSKKAPLGGLGNLSFTIQRAGPDTDQLPTAHTCFNVLVLPEYASAEKLRRLLKIAIMECEGFGLK